MMKNYYKLIRNRRVIAENEDLDVVKDIASVDAKTPLEWKDFSDERIFYQCAFGPGTVANGRTEYEIEIQRKRA